MPPPRFIPARWRTRALLSAELIAAALLAFWIVGHSLLGSPAHAGAAGPAPSIEDQVGLTHLEQDRSQRIPTGRGIILGHVEGNAGDYLPGFNEPALRGLTLQACSGSSMTNAHSDMTTQTIVGRTGLAPGIGRIDFYSAPHWMGPGFLHTHSSQPPATTPVQLFTHSWIAAKANFVEDALARIDHVVDAQGVMIVAGVNNGRDAPVPALLGSAHNIIAVGAFDGDSSGGYTTEDGAGRCKPDIVGPGDKTSLSTPVVAAVVARLMEAARWPQAPADARRPQVLKAILLAGAEKPPGWHAAPGKPLDEHFGAGRVRLDNSLQLLRGGVEAEAWREDAATPAAASQPEADPSSLKPQAPSPAPPSPDPVNLTLTNRYGWAYAALAPAQGHDYLFATPRVLGEASLMLVWDRRVKGQVVTDLLNGRPFRVGQPRDASLVLELFVRDDAGRETLAARSASTIDNLQHVYLKSLPPGRYRIHISRQDHLDEPWDYALAWRIEPAPAQ